jgi:hypothetical protein
MGDGGEHQPVDAIEQAAVAGNERACVLDAITPLKP